MYYYVRAAADKYDLNVFVRSFFFVVHVFSFSFSVAAIFTLFGVLLRVRQFMWLDN